MTALGSDSFEWQVSCLLHIVEEPLSAFPLQSNPLIISSPFITTSTQIYSINSLGTMNAEMSLRFVS